MAHGHAATARSVWSAAAASTSSTSAVSQADGEVVGAVLLTFDVTEQAYAERSRREFTANVSHELKTPLQGIIGSAELLENGMVKPEDVPRFVGHIRAEAQRLVTLIDDIIRLSELDEGGSLPDRAGGPAAPSATDRSESLEMPPPQRGQVTVTVTGESRCGPRRSGASCRRWSYNLCDNAIKYNEDGGSVAVAVEPGRPPTPCSPWRDTGIGIPPEQQEPRLRALLPRGQEPLQGLRRHRTGPVHRQARRGLSPRHRHAGQP